MDELCNCEWLDSLTRGFLFRCGVEDKASSQIIKILGQEKGIEKLSKYFQLAYSVGVQLCT